MRFASADALWLLLILPFMAVYLIYFRAGDLPAFRFPSIRRLIGDAAPRMLPPGVFFAGALRIAAVTLLILALARPQKGLRSEETTTKATDIVIVLDASRSMLTIDFKPENRFEVARKTIGEFIKGRPNDRLGLVLFAQYAITQCPLTTDRTALLNILETVQVGTIAPDQTAVGMGLSTAVNRLRNSQAKSKVVILLTDGANNSGVIDPITAAKSAAAFGIRVYTIGVGTTEGGLMPVDDPILGRRLVPVKSDLDEDTLLKIAESTGAKYFRARTESALPTIFKEIDALEKTDIKVQEYVDYQELYVGFLLAAALLLLTELALSKTLFRTLP